jgi:hypothetical protein
MVRSPKAIASQTTLFSTMPVVIRNDTSITVKQSQAILSRMG